MGDVWIQAFVAHINFFSVEYGKHFGASARLCHLVNKIKKQGQSEKSAKAIAGAVASYKAKGGGKGPTAKQKG